MRNSAVKSSALHLNRSPSLVTRVQCRPGSALQISVPSQVNALHKSTPNSASLLQINAPGEASEFQINQTNPENVLHKSTPSLTSASSISSPKLVSSLKCTPTPISLQCTSTLSLTLQCSTELPS